MDMGWLHTAEHTVENSTGQYSTVHYELGCTIVIFVLDTVSILDIYQRDTIGGHKLRAQSGIIPVHSLAVEYFEKSLKVLTTRDN